MDWQTDRQRQTDATSYALCWRPAKLIIKLEMLVRPQISTLTFFNCAHFRDKKVKIRLRISISLWINLWQSYGASPAIWDHTVLPATRHRWRCPTLTPAMHAGTRFIYPEGIEGWVDLVTRKRSRRNVLNSRRLGPESNALTTEPPSNNRLIVAKFRDNRSAKGDRRFRAEKRRKKIKTEKEKVRQQ